MYQFAVVALLGLTTLKVVDLLTEHVGAFNRSRTLLTFLTAIGAAVAVDYSVFGGFGVDVREPWVGTLFTGLIVASLASVWAAVLSWLGGVTSSQQPGQTRKERPRVAA